MKLSEYRFFLVKREEKEIDLSDGYDILKLNKKELRIREIT